MQRAGLELMDMMAVYQEGAYERLCRYLSLLLSEILKKDLMVETLVFGFSMNSSLLILEP